MSVARTSVLAGPLAKILAGLPEDATQELLVRAREAIRPYETATAIELPGVSLIAGALRG